MSDNAQLRLATVGTSMITEKFLNAADRTAGLLPYGVFSRSEEKARALGKPHGAEAFYTDYAQLLADDKVDVVYIAAPNSLHYKYMLQAIDAGKAVICEKPFVSNMREFNEIKRKTKEKNAMVLEAITVLSMPNMAVLKNALCSIAPLHLVRIDFSIFSPRYTLLREGERSNIFSTEYSGGAMYDLGVYCAHIAVALFGKPQRITALCNSKEFGVDTSGEVLLQYESMVCALSFSKDTFANAESIFQGENGCVKAFGSPGKLSKLTLTKADGAVEDISLIQDENPMVYEAADFVRIIKNRDNDAVQRAMEQSEAVMQLLCDARKSAGIVFEADKA